MSNHPIIKALQARLESERNTEAVNHEETLSDEYMEETSPLEMVQSAYKSGDEAATERLMSIVEKMLGVIEKYEPYCVIVTTPAHGIEMQEFEEIWLAREFLEDLKKEYIHAK